MKSCRTFLASVLLVVLGSSSQLALGQADTSPKPPTYPSEIEGRTAAEWQQDLKNEDPSKREKAVRAIIAFGPLSSEVVTSLITLTNNRDVSPRCRAVMALGLAELKKEDLPRVIDALGKVLEFDTQLIVRYHAALGLVRYGDHCQNVIKAVVIACGDQTSSWEIRQVCVSILAQAGKIKNGPSDVHAFRAVARSLTDPAGEVRMEAIMAIGYLGKCGEPAVQAVAEGNLLIIARGSDKVLAMWATYSLMRIGGPVDAHIAVIVKNLKSTDVRLKSQAARVIGNMGEKGKPHIPALVELLNDPEPVVVASAIYALAGLAPDAQAALKPLGELKDRKDVDKGLQAAAANAIEQITKARH